MGNLLAALIGFSLIASPVVDVLALHGQKGDETSRPPTKPGKSIEPIRAANVYKYAIRVTQLNNFHKSSTGLAPFTLHNKRCALHASLVVSTTSLDTKFDSYTSLRRSVKKTYSVKAHYFLFFSRSKYDHVRFVRPDTTVLRA